MTEPTAVRVVFVGESLVGKTSLINQFARSSFDQNPPSTIGAVFHSRELVIHGKKVGVQIWDTAGQEKYRSLGPIYYRDASAGICVFDMTEKRSLVNLDVWISEFLKYAQDPLLFVVGNKNDVECENKVGVDEARAFAKKHGAVCEFTSAKTGENVRELFDKIFEALACKDIDGEGMLVRDVGGADAPSCSC